MKLKVASILAAALASACTAPPRPPEPKPPVFTGNETLGEKVSMAHQYCRALGNHQCPGATLRCDAYRQAFVKGCLVKVGVPPDYIAVLTMP